jgi:hypothetical protein
VARADQPPKQKTQPKGIDPKTGKPYEPVEIPVPKKEDFDQMLKRAAKGSPKKAKG